ncbi:hypothetical protein CKAN_00232500 [Cinnamomum micranthum f. kanehirae]|uniref:Uncharacterized protein n=1 Tax=Cinnamomum micranthum f. kanehirae TaxID=337451 RepID=A0A443N673_9MAGN|nr:hypothetical protein CKAN_00232500 [Cinnamomum micranthum f. kanehirae]
MNVKPIWPQIDMNSAKNMEDQDAWLGFCGSIDRQQFRLQSMNFSASSSNVTNEEPPCATAFLLASAISLALFLTFFPSSGSPIKHLTPFSNSSALTHPSFS